MRAEPLSECALCPRLVAFREQNRKAFADWFNAPVPSFGDENARLAVVGLAPGLRGANRTGRPFTGDYAGHLLYSTLIKFGFAKGEYEERADDGLKLTDCLITNAVRCVPPENKPLTVEVKFCRTYLAARLSAMPNLQAIVMLGRIAHDSTLHALNLRLAAYKFGHGAVHRPPDLPTLFDSYHCSRYNTSTGALTPAMFEAVFSAVRSSLQ